MAWFPECQWEKDPVGYCIENREPKPGKTILTSEPGGLYIVGKSGKRETVELHPKGLSGVPECIEFANTRSLGEGYCGLISFVGRYGLPAMAREMNEQRVDDFNHQAWKIRGAVERLVQGKANDLAIRLGMENQIRLQRGDLILTMARLSGFLWAQVLFIAERKARVRRCGICYGYYIPKSEKRRWCSDRCKKRAHRAK